MRVLLAAGVVILASLWYSSLKFATQEEFVILEGACYRPFLKGKGYKVGFWKQRNISKDRGLSAADQYPNFMEK